MITDLTEGKPLKLLLRFSAPMLLSVVFQQLYNISDSIIAGKFIDVNSLAAVGNAGQITFIFMAFAIGANVGSSVVVSQFFGSRDMKNLKTAVFTSLITISALALILSVFGLAFTEPILRLMKTPADIYSDTASYLRIYIVGLIFLFTYNITNGIFSALGDSKTPFYFLLFSSASNVALDLLFVIKFDWGVAGVAWATLICQGIASVLSLLTLLYRLKFLNRLKSPYYTFAMFKTISKLAVPSILQQSFVSVGNLFIMSKVNTFDNSFIAGYSAAMKLNTFAVTTCMAMSNALSSFTAQNMGAHRIHRVKEGFKYGLLLAEGLAIIFIIIYLAFPKQVISLFLDLSKPEQIQHAQEAGMHFMYIVVPSYIIMTLKIVADGVLKGSGSMLEFMTGTFLSLFIRVACSFALTDIIGSDGIWLALPIGWIFPAGVSLYFYKKGKWMNRSVIH